MNIKSSFPTSKSRFRSLIAGSVVGIGVAVPAMGEQAGTQQPGFERDWPANPVEGVPLEIDKLVDMPDISGASWNQHDNVLWVVNSKGIISEVERQPDKTWEVTDNSFDIKSSAVLRAQQEGRNDWFYMDLEGCAQMDHASQNNELYVLSEQSGSLVQIVDIHTNGKDPSVENTWTFTDKDIFGNEGIPAELDKDLWGTHDGANKRLHPKGVGPEALEFLSWDMLGVRPNNEQDQSGYAEEGDPFGDRVNSTGYTSLFLIDDLYESTYSSVDDSDLEDEMKACDPGRTWVPHNFGEPGAPKWGELVLVGHQQLGRLWLLEFNPKVGGKFINHGFYRTHAQEICGLHTDHETGRLYIWHGETPGFEMSSDAFVYGSDQNMLEVWQLDRSDKGISWKLYEVSEEDVPGVNTAKKDTNFESIAMVHSIDMYGASPHQKMLFLAQDETKETPDKSPVSMYMFSIDKADIDGNGVIDAADVLNAAVDNP
ncbi:MAG: hypothetical protein P8J89_10600, partial [Phycisphaerales bacterium]|nr:hypothetical protein [Phycisphaerales bacterium]